MIMEVTEIIAKELGRIQLAVLTALYGDKIITEKQFDYYKDQHFVKLIKTEELPDHMQKLIDDKSMWFYSLRIKE